ncbi:MAG: class I SAM-dependent methyltransferase [Limnochordia bacterium]
MSSSPRETDRYDQESLCRIDVQSPSGTAQEVDFLATELGLSASAAVLDLGCGAGRHAMELARRGYLVVGLGISDHMPLRHADERQRTTLQWTSGKPICTIWIVSPMGTLSALTGPSTLGDSGLGVLGGQRGYAFCIGAVGRLLHPG